MAVQMREPSSSCCRSYDGLLDGLGGGIVGVGKSAETLGCSAETVAQGLGHEGCLRIESISVLLCRLRVAYVDHLGDRRVRPGRRGRHV
ncbi:hypothetical protein [Streptomyces werraensis]|uniref:hypothetical protein n=1 Tax=Streptomyces werraensis TaxID=68284 RepID=UPI00382E9791